MDKVRLYLETRRRGVAWLLAHLNADGSIGPVAETQGIYYYRVPWALAVSGETEAANRLVDWIRANMFSAEGAFRGKYSQGEFETRYCSYPLACLMVGAQLLQQFDITTRGLNYLRTLQDPELGGFYARVDQRDGAGEQELFPTAQGGMTYLMVGDLAAAQRAARYFQRLYDTQPDIQHKLYAVMTLQHGLVTDFPAEQAMNYVTDAHDPWQPHYNGGIAAAFLSRLYLATQVPAYLELARKYQQFSMNTDEIQFQSAQVCKSGWGAGLLYQITREQVYRDWTERLGDWFAANQYADGHWENTHHWNPHPTVADNIEVTAEFVMHMDTIIQSLAV
ncbi:MAG: hypothetical protein EXR62_04380 [Chloroflexi bacterium]|nr:hypothetical protein [Chloroflexota bacterium]